VNADTREEGRQGGKKWTNWWFLSQPGVTKEIYNELY